MNCSTSYLGRKGPVYTVVPGTDLMELAEDYCFQVDGLEIWIPAGYRWNGASIPKILWSLLGGRYEPDRLQASLEHDWIYLFHCTTRKAADLQFHLRLMEAGMSPLKTEAMYRAVRVFGGPHWPTSADDVEDIKAIRAMVEARPSPERFTRMMLVE